MKNLQITVIAALGERHTAFPLEYPGRAEGIEAFVHQGIDAAQEHARHRSQLFAIPPAIQPAQRAAQKGLRHGLVLRKGKNQGDVDADACGAQLLEGTHAGGRGRHLDEQVVASHRLPQSPRGGYGARHVVRQGGRDFQAGIAGLAKAGRVGRQQDVAGRLDVGNDERLVARPGIELRVAQAVQVVAVVRVAGNGFPEDGGIGGHAVDAVLGHQTLQRAFPEQRAGEIVEPVCAACGCNFGTRFATSMTRWKRSRVLSTTMSNGVVMVPSSL